MQEVWKAVPGYESYYEVSNQGRVRSLERRTTDRLGRPFVRYGKVLSLNTEAKGYKSIRLCVETKHRIFKVHRLVASAFLPAPAAGQQINHMNGIKDDNRPENLEWVTPEQNMRHAFSNGLGRSSLGEKNTRAILCSDDVRYIRQMSVEGVSCAAISRSYNVSEAAIRQILKGRNWAHVV